MSEEMQSTKSLRAIRSKPELVTVGDRTIVSNGRWNDDLILQYVLDNGRDDWLTVGELAKVVYGANLINTKKSVRKNLRSLFLLLMKKHGEILLVEYEPPYGRAKAVKIFDKGSELDRQTIVSRIDTMRSKGDHAKAELDSAMQIIRNTWPDDIERVFDVDEQQP